MLDAFSAAGSLVHTPSGPRKSRRPLSVLMPAPVRTTTRRASANQPRTSSRRSTPAGYLPLDDHLKDIETAWTSPDLFRVEEPRHARPAHLPHRHASPSRPGPIRSSTRWATTCARPTSSASGWACSARAPRGSCGGSSAGSTSTPTAIRSTSPSPPRSSVSEPGPDRTRRSSGRSTAAAASGPPNRSVTTRSACGASCPRSHACQLTRLPVALQEAHTAWVEGPGTSLPVDQLRERARGLALSLLELGEDVEATERQLHVWRLHPAHRPRGGGVGRRTAAGHPPRSARSAPARRRLRTRAKGPFGPPPSLATASMLPRRSGQGSG